MFLTRIFKEIRHQCARVALNSGHRVVERFNYRWNEVSMERFLEFFSHINSHLADTMQ
jgi:hypothetical protein